jgi:hypothetical protein
MASSVCNERGLTLAHQLSGSASNEWGVTGIKPRATTSTRISDADTSFFLHTIFTGLVPLFSPFFLAILEHYRIQALHLHPNFVLILSSFAFTCEAFLGVEPSVALFRHFYSLRVTAGA